MDEALFGLTAFNNEFEPFKTYELNYNYLKNWLTWRAAWMDGNIGRIHDGAIENTQCEYGGRDYGLVFDASYYRSLNSGLVGAFSDSMALRHFCERGMAQGLVASRNFDVNAYKANNANLRALYGDDLQKYYLHYIETGFGEGRVAA